MQASDAARATGWRLRVSDHLAVLPLPLPLRACYSARDAHTTAAAHAEGAQVTKESRKDLALKLWVVLARAHAAIEEHARAHAATHGLTLPEFGILEALYHKGQMLLGELQRKILVSSGGITYLVDRLEEKGLVERLECPDDRRARYAALTRQGDKLMQHISRSTRRPSRSLLVRSMKPASERPCGCSVTSVRARPSSSSAIPSSPERPSSS